MEVRCFGKFLALNPKPFLELFLPPRQDIHRCFDGAHVAEVRSPSQLADPDVQGLGFGGSGFRGFGFRFQCLELRGFGS